MDVFSKEFLSWISEKTQNGQSVICVSDPNNDDNISAIAQLFHKVDEYVRTNYYMDVEEYGGIYNITDGTNFYTIYQLFGPDIVYRIARTNNKPSYIHLDDVKNNVVRGRINLEVSQRMKEIAINLKELNKLGVPMKIVASETNRLLLEFRNKDKRRSNEE